MAALFALTPGLVDQREILDWTKNNNVKLYKTVTESLYSDFDKYYDGSPDKLPDFLDLFSYRADNYV